MYVSQSHRPLGPLAVALGLSVSRVAHGCGWLLYCCSTLRRLAHHPHPTDFGCKCTFDM